MPQQVRDRADLIRLLLTLLAVAGTLCFAGVAANACEACGCQAAAQENKSLDVSQAQAPEADRQAILAMAGEYKVTFQFQETVAIEPGYELKDPYLSGATEFVEVVEDRGDFISLQHILVLHPQNEDGSLDQEAEARVVKHWRQDWTYQDTQINEFRGERLWDRVDLPAERVQGQWSQAVFQVDDSPRYEGLGKWTHAGSRSSWESQETWRPLPRREHTKRSDYDVLVAQNRHTITPNGWVHEADSYKLVLGKDGQPDRVLAHESGLNVYDKVDNIDFTVGREYWEATQAYWQDVREMWIDVLAEPGQTHVAIKAGDKLVYAELFGIARDIQDAGQYQSEHRKQAQNVVFAAIQRPQDESSE